MKFILYITLLVAGIFIGLNYYHDDLWMRGYCWGFLEGQLEARTGRLEIHNVEAMIQGVKYEMRYNRY